MLSFQIIRALSFAEFRTRYVSSFRGFMWSFIKPIFYFALYYLIFSKLIGKGAGNYAIYLFSGIIVWTFLSEISSRSNFLFRINSPILQLFKFDKSNLIFSTIMTGLATFFGMIVILIIAMVFLGSFSYIHPLVLLISFAASIIFAVELSIFCSIVSLYFEDFPNIWELISMSLFWLAPIVYSVSRFEGLFVIIIKLNAFTWLIESFRYGFGIISDFNIPHFMLFFLILSLLLIPMLYWFKKVSRIAVDLL